MKKVVHIIPYFASYVSGPTNSVWNLFQHTRSVSKEIWALDWGSNVVEDHSVKYYDKTLHWRLGFSLGFYKDIRVLLKNPDVIIHNHGLWMFQSLFTLFVTGKIEAIVIQSPRGAFSKKAMTQGGLLKYLFWIFFQKPALRKVNWFHATSISEQEDIRRLGFDQKIFLLPNGVNYVDFKSESRSKNYIYLGRFHREKNLKLLLDAWGQFNRESTNLFLYGEGHIDVINEVKEYIEKNRLKNVRILDPIYGNDKLKVLAESRALLFPSLSENFAISIAESLSVGTPVLCTSGTPWMEIDNKAGYCVEGCLRDFHEGLVKLHNLSDDEYMGFSSNAKKLIKEKYDWCKIGLKYTALINNET